MLGRFRGRINEIWSPVTAGTKSVKKGVAGPRVTRTPHIRDDHIERLVLKQPQRFFGRGRQYESHAQGFEGAPFVDVVAGLIIDPEHERANQHPLNACVGERVRNRTRIYCRAAAGFICGALFGGCGAEGCSPLRSAADGPMLRARAP